MRTMRTLRTWWPGRGHRYLPAGPRPGSRAVLASAVAAVALATVAAAQPTAAGAAEQAASGATTGAPGTAAVPPSQLLIGTQPLATGLGRLTAIAAPDDGSNRLFVAEKSGTVRVFQIGQGLRAGFYLDIRTRVSTSGNERGLLGIATSRDFATTRTVVIAYTRRQDNAVTLSRFRLTSAGQTTVAASSEEQLLAVGHSQFSNHNGGQVAFGPDGFLYWGIGDGGGAGDPLATGQNLNALLGKVLRVDVLRGCNGRLYCVPAGNPFVGQTGARPEIWAWGLRNPWRFSFDRGDGSLWIGDVGQNTLEEIDRLAGTQAGANLGWSCREGTNIFNQSRCVSGRTFVNPLFTYRTGTEGCAVTGGFVYRGARFAGIAAGTYVLGDYCSAAAWGIQRGTTTSVARIGSLPGQTTTFGEDQAGELYLATDTGQLAAVTFSQR